MVSLGGITYHCDTAGPWISTEIFFQGCGKRCEGCFNPQLQSTTGGQIFEIDDLVSLLVEHVPYKRVTISGGEPFIQSHALGELAEKLKSFGFTIICYTGYVWEDLINHLVGNHDTTSTLWVLNNIDILVDGPFNIEMINEGTGLEPGKWVGSRNQRVIDVSKSLEERRVVLWKNM